MGCRHRKKLAVTELKLQKSFKLKAVGKEEMWKNASFGQNFQISVKKKR